MLVASPTLLSSMTSSSPSSFRARGTPRTSNTRDETQGRFSSSPGTALSTNSFGSNRSTGSMSNTSESITSHAHIQADSIANSNATSDTARPDTALRDPEGETQRNSKAEPQDTGAKLSATMATDSSPQTKRRQAPSQEALAQPIQLEELDAKRAKPVSSKKILPNRYELCEAQDVVVLIADMIAELIETNDNLPLRDPVLTRFHSRTPPCISVIDYLQRLAKHAALTPPLLLSMVYYIDRLCSMYPAFTITTLTVHRFLITAATVAAKGLSDSFWNNATYARVGGIKVAELGLLELEFLYRVDWRIVPSPEVLVDYYQGLVSRSDKYALQPSPIALQPQVPTNKSAPSGAEDHVKLQQGAGNADTKTKWDTWMQDVTDAQGPSS